MDNVDKDPIVGAWDVVIGPCVLPEAEITTAFNADRTLVSDGVAGR